MKRRALLYTLPVGLAGFALAVTALTSGAVESDTGAIPAAKVAISSQEINSRLGGAPSEISPKGTSADQAEAQKIIVAEAAKTGSQGDAAPAAKYHRAQWDPIHFKPAIDEATDEDCLACHQEILSYKPREETPTGVKAGDTLAWYQTLDTYSGGQESFHWRHMQSPYAQEVMNLSCTFCHQGNDPREESPGVVTVGAEPGAFALRKMINPSETCLRCHGQYNFELMGTGPWHEYRVDIESEDMPNGCLSCHDKEFGFRSVRHQVNYLKADAIEEAAQAGSDVCFGCHGGRSWYRISYPYPRHAWPDMDPEVPDWAKDRPTESGARFRLQ